MKRLMQMCRSRLSTWIVGFCALVFANTSFSLTAGKAQSGRGWEKIGGPKGVVVSQTLGGIYATYATEGPGLNPTGDICILIYGNWEKIGVQGKNFVVGPSTPQAPRLVGLAADGKSVWLLNDTNYALKHQGGKTFVYYGWTEIGGPAAEIYGGGAGIFATNPSSGDLMAYHNGTWTKIGGPGKTFVVNDKNLFGLSPDGHGVFQYSGIPMKWIQIGGPAANLYAGGDSLFATNPNSGDIYRYEGKAFNWTRVGGPGKMFAVVGNGLFGLSPDGKAVFRHHRYYNQAIPDNWENIGSPDGVGVDRIIGGGIYLYATISTSKELWRYWSPDP